MFIRFSPLSDFVSKAFCEVDIHFVLFEIVVFFAVRNHGVLLDCMGTPPWGPHGDNLSRHLSVFDMIIIITRYDYYDYYHY